MRPLGSNMPGFVHRTKCFRDTRRRKRWWGGRAGSSRTGAEAAPGRVRACRPSSLNCFLVYCRETPRTCRDRGDRCPINARSCCGSVAHSNGVSDAVVPGNTLDELLLVLIQAHGESRSIRSTVHLHLVHLHLWYVDLLPEGGGESVSGLCFKGRAAMRLCLILHVNPPPGCSPF